MDRYTIKDYVLAKVVLFLLLFCGVGFAAPPDNNIAGRLIFLGVSHDSTKSIWLSVTDAAGSFRLEAQGNQIVDAWDKDARGLRVSISPFVSSGNGGTHFLINAANDKKLDSQNQSGGIVFPPFPTLPPEVLPPLFPEHPIVIPPGEPVFPEHPIVIPPGEPVSPEHPIVIPPEEPGSPEHPIVIPPEEPGSPEHPVEQPPDSGSTPTQPSEQNTSEKGKTKKKQKAPITPARQLIEEPKWNIWSDNYYYGISDTRGGLNSNGSATNFVIGADRRVTNNVVGGFMLAAIGFDTKAFGGELENKADGYNIGPYFGYQISPHWSTDGSLSYGELQNNNKISVLTSQYITQFVNGTLHATGLYQFGSFQLRPQPMLSYTHFRNPTYDFAGTVADTPIAVTRESENFNFGLAEFKLEGNYTVESKKGNIFQPYAEAGIDYAFTRPSDGVIYSGNLSFITISPISGLVTAGVRTVLGKKLLIDANASYRSLGQNGFDVWDVRLLAAYSFA